MSIFDWLFRSTLTKRVNEMSETIDELTTRVTEIETVADSAIELINGLKVQLDEAIAGGDMGIIQELSDRLGAQSAELAAAIEANTGDIDPPEV